MIKFRSTVSTIEMDFKGEYYEHNVAVNERLFNEPDGKEVFLKNWQKHGEVLWDKIALLIQSSKEQEPTK